MVKPVRPQQQKRKYVPKEKKEKRISMQSIADEVGVARSTVSFVLNGKEKEGRISEELAAKVRQAAQRMNYRINEIARSLRTGRTNTIALIVADISDVFFGLIAYHLQEYAETKGYALIILNTSEKKERLKSVFNMLTNRQIDGIIMVPVANIKEEDIKALCPPVPLVYIDRYFMSLNTSRVIINNYEITKLATQLLIGKGCHRIGFITYRESLMHLQDRKSGYMDALKATGHYDESLVCEIDYLALKSESILEFLQEKLAASALDGLVLATHGITSLSLRILIKLGVKPQTDIQVIGFGRMDVAVGFSIPYVQQPIKDICEKSFDILLENIELKDQFKPINCVLSAAIVTDP